MKLLKGLALSLLSFLLFLSLSTFGIVLTLNYTILNPDFIVSELNQLDISSMVKDLFSSQIPQDEPYVAEAIDNTLADLEPWIRDQMQDTIYSGYDYLLRKSQHLALEISLEPLRDSLKDNLREAILQSPPPELEGESPTVIELYISQIHQYVEEMIPPRFELNENSLDPEVLSQLMEVKEAIGYVQLAYRILITLILLLILGIILMQRQVKGASRELGIIFTTYGAFEYVGIIIAKHLIGTQLPQFGMPSAFQDWLPQLLKDILLPLEIFSLVLLVVGIALIIVSFLYKPRQPAETEAL